MVSDLAQARATVSDHDAGKKLDNILGKLQQSLDGSLWDGNSHIQEKKGDRVFNLQQDAAHKLMDLLKGKKRFLSSRALTGILQRLTDATRSVVEDAIEDSGGDPKKLRDAMKELDKAEDELNDGHFDAAIAHLKNAWKKALDAGK